MTFMSEDATLLDRELRQVLHVMLSWLTILQVAILTQVENISGRRHEYETV
jgi:hypothetical protein